MPSKHVRLTFSPDLIKQPYVYQLGHQFKVVTKNMQGEPVLPTDEDFSGVEMP